MIRAYGLEEAFLHGVLIGMVVGLADIDLTAGLADLDLDVDRIAFSIKQAAGNVTAGVIAERAVVEAESYALCVFILPRSSSPYSLQAEVRGGRKILQGYERGQERIGIR